MIVLLNLEWVLLPVEGFKNITWNNLFDSVYERERERRFIYGAKG